MTFSRRAIIWASLVVGGLLTAPFLFTPNVGVSNAGVSSVYNDSAELIGSKSHKIYVLNNDPAGYTLRSVSKPLSGVAEVVENSIVYTAPDEFEGEDTFQYQAQNRRPADVGNAEISMEGLPDKAAVLFMKGPVKSEDLPDLIPFFLGGVPSG